MNARLRLDAAYLASVAEPQTPSEWFDLLSEQEKVALYDDFVWWNAQIEEAFTAWLENHKDYRSENPREPE